MRQCRAAKHDRGIRKLTTCTSIIQAAQKQDKAEISPMQPGLNCSSNWGMDSESGSSPSFVNASGVAPERASGAPENHSNRRNCGWGYADGAPARGHERKTNSLPVSAGLTGLRPTPPKTSLPNTMRTHGNHEHPQSVVTGKIMTISIPVTRKPS
jgi:hypothetical protein